MLNSEDKEQSEQKLTDQLKKVTWPVDYGSVKIQVRAGKPSLITVEKTIKLD